MLADTLYCRICIWYERQTEATHRGQAPDGTWHNLCGDHALMHESTYGHTEVLSTERKQQLLNQTPTDQMRETSE